jgi:hypothetical protein
MKGIALSTLAYMILAIISLIVILSLVWNKIYPSVKDVYCKILIGSRLLLPLPSNMKTDLPTFCRRDSYDVNIETFELLTGNPERIAFDIAAYSKACWEKTSNIARENVICYEIILKRVDGEVNEEMVKNALGSDQYILMWSADLITKPKSIAIIYNSNENKIEVR